MAAPGDSCTYTGTRAGGYVANGSTWSFVVDIPTAAGDPRDANLDGKLTYTFGPDNAPPVGCSLWPAGATVTVSAGSSGGIAGGNPFPAPTDERPGQHLRRRHVAGPHRRDAAVGRSGGREQRGGPSGPPLLVVEGGIHVARE